MSDGDLCPNCSLGKMHRRALREDDGRPIRWYEECDLCHTARPERSSRAPVKADARTKSLEGFA